ANVEKAAIGTPPGGAPAPSAPPALKKVRTPGKRTVEEVGAFLSEPPERFIKTLLYTTNTGETVAALVRGDHELSETKVGDALAVGWVAMADAETVQRLTGAEVGFAGPVGLRVRTIADHALRRVTGAVTGANETDHHLVDVSQERDFAD